MRNVGESHSFNENEEPIGRGAFSRVYLGHDNTNEDKVAIKVIELPQMDGKMKRVLREIEIMRHLKHENVVQLFDIQYDRTGNGGMRIFIVMEFCSQGDISTLPKPMGEEKCQRYFRAIVSGLRYLNKRGIVHRDIKPQNVLLTRNDEIKLADFTFAKHMEEQQMMETVCGTPLYIAPEIMNGDLYDSKCDLWSLGVMLYQFLYGTHPLGTIKSHNELAKRLRTTKISYPQKLVMETYEKCEGKSILCRVVHVFSVECLEFVKGLLKKNPTERFSWKEVSASTWLQLEEEELFPLQTGGIHACSAPMLQAESPPVFAVPRPPPPRSIQKQHSSKKLSTTPTSDNSTSWGFKMSDDESLESKSRIIPDYQGNNEPHVITSPRKRGSVTLLSRSIEALHRVFY